MNNYGVLIGQVFQETHSFSPLKTAKSDFAITRGSEIIENEQVGCLGGMISAGMHRGVELVPTIVAISRPE